MKTKQVPTEDQTGTTKVASDSAMVGHRQQTCAKTAVDTRGNDDLTDRAELEDKGCGQPHPHQEKPHLPKSASTAASTSGKSTSTSAKEGKPFGGTCLRRGRGGKRGGRGGSGGVEKRVESRGKTGEEEEEEEEGLRCVRPRAGRPPGQRMFVLSHAPLTRADGGHRGRGAGRTKAGRVRGGGGRRGRVNTAKSLVTTFDFGDSPAVGGGVVSPPIPTPHSIPSSLPSPDYIPSSGPHSRPLKSKRSKSVLLRSLPDSDYDTDPDDATWKEDISSGSSKPSSGRPREPVTVAERGDGMERGKGVGEKEKAAVESSSMADKADKKEKKGKREGGKKGKMLATKRAGGRKLQINPCESQESGETREGEDGVTLAAVKTTGVAGRGEGGKRGRGRPRKNNTTSSATDRADTTQDKKREDLLPPTKGGLERPKNTTPVASKFATKANATNRGENDPENSGDVLPLTKSNRGGRQTKLPSATKPAKADDGWSATVANGSVLGNTTSLAKSGRQRRDNLTSASANTSGPDTNRAKIRERERNEVSKSALNKKKQMDKERVEKCKESRYDVQDDDVIEEPSSSEGLQSPTVSTLTSSPVASGTRRHNMADEVGEVGNKGTRGERSPVRKKHRSSSGYVSEVTLLLQFPGIPGILSKLHPQPAGNLVAQAWNQSPPLPLQSSTADCQLRGKPRAAGRGRTSKGNGQKERERKKREKKEREEKEEREERERKEREERERKKREKNEREEKEREEKEREERERKRRSASETTGQRRSNLTSERKRGLESRQVTPLTPATPDIANISIQSGNQEESSGSGGWSQGSGGGVAGDGEGEESSDLQPHEGVVKCLTSVEKTDGGSARSDGPIPASLSDMEQRQSQGRGVAQQGLKRDIQLIQQRSVRKAVPMATLEGAPRATPLVPPLLLSGLEDGICGGMVLN
ncbi:hypothetical protein GBAR_LOCUS30016 [Geodia barretti]|uniref:Uncharacterized protein n=1 Tax=Geodia barretti TaxID=519541 RepID=A0AA35TW58_GEOBA|nr:hypothetical protein GBAR_LOCUS30016 [Geodia barretti]